MANPYALFVQKKDNPTIFGVSPTGQFTALDANSYAAAGGSTQIDPNTGIYQGVQLRGNELVIPQGTLDFAGKPYGVAPAPATNPTIPASTMTNPPQPVDVSATIPPPDNTANANVAGAEAAQKTTQDYVNQLPTPPGPQEQQYNDILGQINNLLPQEANKPTDQLAAEQANNVSGLKKDLADVNAQIATRTAQYNQLYTTEQGKPITMSSIIGAQAQIQKQEAADIGLLQARALGLSGQVNAAQDAANRAVDLKYSVLEAQISVKEEQLKLIQPLLNKEEQIQAAAQQQVLNDQAQKIAEKKQNDKDIQNLALQAAQNGADGTTVAKIQQATSIEQATQLLATFGQQQQVTADQKATEQANVKIAQTAGITTRYYNYAGEWRDSITGHAFKTPEEFYAAAGVTSFADAYAKGLVTDFKGTGTTATQTWSDPYSLGGDLVQRNNTTGEIRTAVNVASGSGKTSETDQIKADIATTNQSLRNIAGSDGYVDTGPWKESYNDWVNAGYLPKDFISTFQQYINPDYREFYFGVND